MAMDTLAPQTKKRRRTTKRLWQQSSESAPLYAIRKSDTLRTRAIFLYWEDCSFYVDNEEKESSLEYQ
jgi:hypothetical protein